MVKQRRNLILEDIIVYLQMLFFHPHFYQIFGTKHTFVVHFDMSNLEKNFLIFFKLIIIPPY